MGREAEGSQHGDSWWRGQKELVLTLGGSWMRGGMGSDMHTSDINWVQPDNNIFVVGSEVKAGQQETRTKRNTAGYFMREKEALKSD